MFKTARLEAKLDDLVLLLEAGAQFSAIAADAPATAAIYDSAHHSSVRTNDKTSPYSQTEEGSVMSVLNDSLPDLPALIPGTTSSEDTSCNSPASGLYDVVEPSPIEAEEYLSIFHIHKSKYFPFVHIPSTTTAQQLRQERPVL